MSSLYRKLSYYGALMRVQKPIGFFLILWPTLMALWIAGQGTPNPSIVCIFILGTWVMRSAGCVANDFADRGIDGAVTRTRDRVLPRKLVTEKEALGLLVGLFLVALMLVLQLNVLTMILSVFALALTLIYPFMKRYTHLPQVMLGAAFAWAVPMAFAAETNHIPIGAFLLFFATLIWTVAYDTEYAMVDRADDLRIKVKSTAILFGKLDRFMIFACHIIALLLFGIVGHQFNLGKFYYLGVITSLVLIIYQQYLIKDRNPQLAFQAFLNNNAVGAVLFLGVMLDYMFD